MNILHRILHSFGRSEEQELIHSWNLSPNDVWLLKSGAVVNGGGVTMPSGLYLTAVQFTDLAYELRNFD